MKIQTKTMIRGNPKESAWPTEFGKPERGIFYRDKETGELKRGYPPQFQKFGQAPAYHSDFIAPQEHPSIGQVISSKKEWLAVDQVAGTQTFFGSDAKQVATSTKWSPTKQKERKEARKKDIHQSMKRAEAALDARMAPRDEHKKPEHPKVVELIDKALKEL